MTAPKSDIKKLNQYVVEAKDSLRQCKADSWGDAEITDGKLPDDVVAEAEEKGIELLPINRIVPVINFICGGIELRPLDITAKGRTKDDTETGHAMTKGIKFVLDQNGGEYKLKTCFRNSIITGVDFLEVLLNTDPREEKIRVAHRSWTNSWWDPFASPWLDPAECRYNFYNPWVDLDSLYALFPGKKKEIKDEFLRLSSERDSSYGGAYEDEGEEIEREKHAYAGSHYADKRRRRVRPVEMKHVQYVEAVFLEYKNGMVIELPEDISDYDQYKMMNDEQVVQLHKANVRKIAVTTFLGDLELQNKWSPFNDGRYNTIPFVGYLDRYNLPYGVPRHIKGQNIEVIKRRSMALALLGAKRVIATDDVADGQKAHDALWAEAQRPDGYVLIKKSLDNQSINNRFLVQDQSQLSAGQLAMMQINQSEINEISGANQPMMGIGGTGQSGVSKQMDIQQGSQVLAPLFGNNKRSLNLLGNKVKSAMQDQWTQEKVLRITDSVTQAERFVVLNQTVILANGEQAIANNITQGRYDIVISQTPATDTVREKNLEMVIEAVKKSPPEMMAPLMVMYFEMSDIPNKESLLAKLKPIMGQNPADEDKSPEELKQDAIKALEAQQAENAQKKQVEDKMVQLEIDNKQLENDKLNAEINEIMAGIANKTKDSNTKEGELRRKAVETAHEIENPQPEART